MFDTLAKHSGKQDRERRASPDSLVSVDAAEEISRYFRDNYPIMLDGALPVGEEQGRLIRQARESLARGRVDPDLLPAAILRETLDGIAAEPQSVTKAGLTAIGPKSARVWWDESVLDNLDDVLARLDRPRPLLRFYDVTGLDPESGRWHEIVDIDVALDEKGRTVQLINNDRTYIVDLGYAYADGRFLRLARTNLIDLPRDAAGAGDSTLTSRSNLRPRLRRVDAAAVPDARARDWADARQDRQERDIEAELVVHMLYRAFLREGPRALRRAPKILRRDDDILRREHAQRTRVRERRAASARMAKSPAPAFLVARLDSVREREAPSIRYVPMPAIPVAGAVALISRGSDTEEFAWYRDLLVAARRGRALEVANLLGMQTAVTPVETEMEDEAALAEPELVQVAPLDADLSFGLLASPVYQAAQNLRKSLADMQALEDEDDDDDAEVAASGVGDRLGKKPIPANRIFGGSEAKRMAKAGVRINRIALTLEGRMRPGARLKVAGKLVHADADGCFRLECVLSGRKASIPMRAGASIGGEARSLINVEWEKRASREKKKIS